VGQLNKHMVAGVGVASAFMVPGSGPSQVLRVEESIALRA